MQMLPIDLTALVAVIGGISIVLVPIIGITARFALKPTVEALGRFMDRKGADETLGILERRVGLMEQQIEAMEGSLARIAEAAEFHRALESPRAPETEGGEQPAS